MSKRLTTIWVKSIGCFLSIVLIFAMGALVVGNNARQTRGEVRAFLDEYWPTSEALMEVRITLGNVAARALNPPPEMQSKEVLDSLNNEIAETRERLKRVDLNPEVLARLDSQLHLFQEGLILPVILHDEPGRKMEEADAVVQPLLDKMGELQEPEILNTTWEAVMNFNDILITGDEAERENFLANTRIIQSHPSFDSFALEYDSFENSANEVFESAIRLNNAREKYQGIYERIDTYLKTVEEEFHSSVTIPASTRIHESLSTISRTVVWVTIATILLSLLIGYAFTRGICSPIDKVKKVLGRMQQGHLDSRVRLERNDEIGAMAAGLDQMAENLGEMVRKVRGSVDELTGVSQNLVSSADSVKKVSERQSEEVARATGAMDAIRASGEKVGKGADHLVESAAESTSSVLEMSANIEEVAQNTEELSVSMDQVTSSIHEMAASLRQISESTTSLKDASDSTVSSVVQMDASIRQVEENVNGTRKITEEVKKDIESGQTAVESTIQGIGEIRRSSRTSSEVILSLSDRVQNIGTILQVIEDVTDQTALLALNAAIIAAQAGEHGSGFSVVADEIRELADRTRNSTQEIAGVIEAVQNETRDAVNAMAEAEVRIGEGEKLSGESRMALEKIVAGIEGVGRKMDQIASSTAEQSKGSRMIRSAMEQVSQMVDQIVVSASEQERGSRAIQGAAERMSEKTEQVKNSTREQSSAAKTIARSTEQIDEMIYAIRSAIEDQGQHSRKVDQAVNRIRETASGNLDVVSDLQGAVSRLAAQVEALQREMTVFKGL